MIYVFFNTIKKLFHELVYWFLQKMKLVRFFINAFLYFVFFALSGCNSEKSSLNGYVEADYKYLSPTSSGILKNLYVQKGDYVQAGTKLFELEDTELKTSVDNAKSEIERAKASLQETEMAYLRAKELIKDNVISKSDLEKMETGYHTSKAQLEISKQNLISAEKRLTDSAIKIEEDTYIEDTFFTTGEFIQSGKPVVSTFSQKDIKIRFFIPQAELPKIKRQKHMLISCDGCAKKIQANITYIAKKAEYTPPVIYSTSSRQKMVFMIEAKPEKEESELHPGLPVSIEFEEEKS